MLSDLPDVLAARPIFLVAAAVAPTLVVVIALFMILDQLGIAATIVNATSSP
ncbi:hypothetical protein [Actinomycetospora callitridis]|uniref:hypothetical protein n=1 Tax=Actinomycetospora callitridis TaxID=913944 RepID=UPI00236583A8|nr:hypothetical protein [Actinomycetospora callitridis]MDD7919106.1 hypothetical protein [Actinomycetospora callitridis]